MFSLPISRSNRAKGRLETIYFALCELETVLTSWQSLASTKQEVSKAKKAFLKQDVAFIGAFVTELSIVKGLLLDAFLQSLIEAFPRHLPTEILVKIWRLSQPHHSADKNFDLVEARKFLLLLKTTVLDVYNLATVGRKKPLF